MVTSARAARSPTARRMSSSSAARLAAAGPQAEVQQPELAAVGGQRDHDPPVDAGRRHLLGVLVGRGDPRDVLAGVSSTTCRPPSSIAWRAADCGASVRGFERRPARRTGARRRGRRCARRSAAGGRRRPSRRARRRRPARGRAGRRAARRPPPATSPRRSARPPRAAPPRAARGAPGPRTPGAAKVIVITVPPPGGACMSIAVVSEAIVGSPSPSPGESARGCIPRPSSVTTTTSSSGAAWMLGPHDPGLAVDEGVHDGVGDRLGDRQREVDQERLGRRRARGRTRAPRCGSCPRVPGSAGSSHAACGRRGRCGASLAPGHGRRTSRAQGDLATSHIQTVPVLIEAAELRVVHLVAGVLGELDLDRLRLEAERRLAGGDQAAAQLGAGLGRAAAAHVAHQQRRRQRLVVAAAPDARFADRDRDDLRRASASPRRRWRRQRFAERPLASRGRGSAGASSCSEGMAYGTISGPLST